MLKVYVVGPNKHYSAWIENHELTDDLGEADIVLFTGGEDVDPSLYGCEAHYTTYSNIDRDLAEKEIFEKVKPNQLCVGICRGSQLLCCLNGGKLIQNVSNHAVYGTHRIINKYDNDERYEITSTHHQMQYPFNLVRDRDYHVLYYAARCSIYYEGDGIEDPPCEPEIVIYHRNDKPKCLAIQGLPEYMRKESPVIGMLNELVNRYVK